MSRLGGGTYKQSYLISGGSTASQTQVIEQSKSPPSSGRHPSLFLPNVVRSESPPTPPAPMFRRVNGAEMGSSSLLPDFSSLSASKSRIRTLSDMNRNTECDSPSDGGLRRRSTFNMDDDSTDSAERRHSMSSVTYPVSGRAHTGSPTPNMLGMGYSKGFTISLVFQLIVIIAVVYLVYDAHFKVQEAAGRLEHYKHEEAVLIHQMDRIEDRATQLQDQLKKLREEHNSGEGLEVTKAQTEDIHNEIHQWKREYFEVNKEVHALQDFMQEDARKELQRRYGKDAVHVNLDLDLGKEPVSQISIELFEEAPHASWAFVQQIENGDWSSASFIWHPAHMVLASPTKASSVKLEFVEKSYHHHEAWTIGLTKSHNGGYNLYVNLQENSHVHEGDVCLGKVIGGFDTLQKLMHRETVAKTPGGEKAYLEPPVAITQFSITTGQRRRRH